MVHLKVQVAEDEEGNKDAPIISSKNLSRYSLVFFTGPLDECLIESIDECISETSSEKKYPPIKSHDHLLMKLNRTNK